MFGGMMNNPMGLMMMSSMFGGDDIFEGMFDFDDEMDVSKMMTADEDSDEEEE